MYTLLVMSYNNKFIISKGTHEPFFVLLDKYDYSIAKEINYSGLFKVYDCNEEQIKQNINYLIKINYTQI